MKPRLRLKNSVWSCTSYSEAGAFCTVLRIGYGYTPKTAYEDWVAQGERGGR